jgi:hypothetical protein
MKYVPVRIAAEQLEVTESCLFRNTNKYRPYLRLCKDGEESAGFDIKGFLKKEDLRTELLEKTKLLTEYLYHEEDISYGEIGKMAGVSAQSVSLCKFNYDTALKIALGIRNNKPEYIRKFDIYYGWEK